MALLFATVIISQFSGIAHNENGDVLFKEHYTVEKEGNKVHRVETIFECPKGNRLASLISKFSSHPHLPDTNYSRKESSHGAKVHGRTIQLYNDDKTKVKQIEPEMVAGHGFYFFLLDHLDDLIGGKKKRLSFLQPDRLSAFDFRLSAALLPTNSDHVSVKMEMNNAFLRAMIPAMHFVINRKTRSLVEYKGFDGFARIVGRRKEITVRYTEPVEQTLLHAPGLATCQSPPCHAPSPPPES